MNTFARTNQANRAADNLGDVAAMQRLLDAEIARLVTLPKFDMATYISNVIRGRFNYA